MISTPLIDSTELASVLDEVILLDARTGADAQAAFNVGHVRGAIRVDLETDLSDLGNPEAGGRHPLPRFDVWLTRLGDWGITKTTPVVIYDAASGGMAAARAWWMLRAVGHDFVAVVDGGWSALGAKNLFWRSLLDPDGRFMPPGELMKRYDTMQGDVPPERVVCYCGSGVTACHLLLGMEACGLEGAQLYVGSWSEWCRVHPPSSESK